MIPSLNPMAVVEPQMLVPLHGSMTYGIYIMSRPHKKLKCWQKLWKQNPRNKNKYKNHKK